MMPRMSSLWAIFARATPVDDEGFATTSNGMVVVFLPTDQQHQDLTGPPTDEVDPVGLC